MVTDITVRDAASYLINTSVQDMQSGLWGYDKSSLAVLRYAHKLTVRRGEKTKANILAAHIKKLEKGKKAGE